MLWLYHIYGYDILFASQFVLYYKNQNNKLLPAGILSSLFFIALNKTTLLYIYSQFSHMLIAEYIIG
jgi:hypothetical protein